VKTATLWFFYYGPTGVAASELVAPAGSWDASGTVTPQAQPRTGGGRSRGGSSLGRIAPRPRPLAAAVTIDGNGQWTAPVGTFTGEGDVSLSALSLQHAFLLGGVDLDVLAYARVAA
jgi:hypothetical protein